MTKWMYVQPAANHTSHFVTCSVAHSWGRSTHTENALLSVPSDIPIIIVIVIVIVIVKVMHLYVRALSLIPCCYFPLPVLLAKLLKGQFSLPPESNQHTASVDGRQAGLTVPC